MQGPSTLSMGIAGVMDPEKFALLDQKLAYRVIHQPCPPCPNDMNGCPRCKAKGGVVGKHLRPIARTTVDGMGIRRQDGRPVYLSHRMLTSPLVLETQTGTVLTPGTDYRLEGRAVTFLTNTVRPAEPFRVRYEAYEESWVNLQHAYADFAGAGRKAESSLNLRFANLEQGTVAMSIGADAHGYRCMMGDRYIPADVSMTFAMNVDQDRQNLRSRHQFVTRIVEAYGVNKVGHEVPLTATWNREDLKFTVTGPEYERAVIIYEACPIYTVYLDAGEWRNPQAENHHRLVLLIREEVGR